MEFSRARLYTVLAIILAAAYGLGVGSSWPTDALVFAALAGVVAFLCYAGRTKIDSILEILRITTPIGRQYVGKPDQRGQAPERIERVPRSRIARYVAISRAKSTKLTDWLRRESNSPFERALFSDPAWRTLSKESLEDVSRRATEAPQEQIVKKKHELLE